MTTVDRLTQSGIKARILTDRSEIATAFPAWAATAPTEYVRLISEMFPSFAEEFGRRIVSVDPVAVEVGGESLYYLCYQEGRFDQIWMGESPYRGATLAVESFLPDSYVHFARSVHNGIYLSSVENGPMALEEMVLLSNEVTEEDVAGNWPEAAIDPQNLYKVATSHMAEICVSPNLRRGEAVAINFQDATVTQHTVGFAEALDDLMRTTLDSYVGYR